MIIKIKNKRYDFFNTVNINLRYDSVGSTFSFNAYFNPDNKDHRELFHVGHYHPITIEHMDELLISGIFLSETFRDSAKKLSTPFGGYSLPGVLEDCQIPTSIYPLESNGLSLREIAQKLVRPFKLQIVIDSSVRSRMNQVYDKTTANETQTISSYLSELASERNIILSHTPKGELLFTQANTTKKPIMDFNLPEGGSIPETKMQLSFNGQRMHSIITVVKQADLDGGNAGQSSVKNPFVPFTFRPKVIVQNSGDDNNTLEVAKNALASELKNVKLTVTVDRWDIDGKTITPNNLISVIAPDLYLYSKTNWFIESVNLLGDNKKETAVLNCVLPEVFNGKTPIYIFEV